MTGSYLGTWREAVEARIRDRTAAKEAETATLRMPPMKTTAGEHIGAVLALLLFWLIDLVLIAAAVLVAYGVAFLVSLHAFGIELPNPATWLPSGWRERVGA